MPPPTLLDAAHAAMEAAPEDEGARLAFYARIASSELYLLLEREPQGEVLDPRSFALETGPVVLAFDAEERLAAFAGAPAPYAALPGRVLARMLAGQGVGLGLNLDVAPSSTLLPPEALEWLAEMLDTAPQEMVARPEELSPPTGLPGALLTALDSSLARGAGLARAAWLARVVYAEKGQGHLLAFVGAAPRAERALAQAVGEALAFSGLEAGALDVAFLMPEDPLTARLARVGLRFDLPQRQAPVQGPTAPGTDPQNPPKLR